MQTKVSQRMERDAGEEGHSNDGKAPRRLGRLLIILPAVAVVVASLAYGLTARGPGPLQEGPAPDFTLDLFGGGQLTLSDLQGQVVLVNFWASWCLPCRDEAPMLEAVWQRYRDQGVTFIGVNYQDTEAPARAFIQEFGITYPNGPDVRSRIAGAFQIQGVPETFVITPEGEIAEVFIGSPTEAQLTDVLERLLASTAEE